jgi:hypothetical protein
MSLTDGSEPPLAAIPERLNRPRKAAANVSSSASRKPPRPRQGRGQHGVAAVLAQGDDVRLRAPGLRPVRGLRQTTAPRSLAGWSGRHKHRRFRFPIDLTTPRGLIQTDRHEPGHQAGVGESASSASRSLSSTSWDARPANSTTVIRTQSPHCGSRTRAPSQSISTVSLRHSDGTLRPCAGR